MRNGTDTVKMETKNSLFYVIEGIGIAYLTTFLLLFIFSTLLTYTNISESIIAPVILIITIISILIGGSIGTCKIKKNGLITGGMIGFFYIIILYVISSLIQTGFDLNLYAILMMIFSILAGMIRGNCSE